MAADGARFDRVIYDEFEDSRQRRELIAVRPDGSTYSADVPAEFDLADILGDGDVVGFDAGSPDSSAGTS